MEKRNKIVSLQKEYNNPIYIYDYERRIETRCRKATHLRQKSAVVHIDFGRNQGETQTIGHSAKQTLSRGC